LNSKGPHPVGASSWWPTRRSGSPLPITSLSGCSLRKTPGQCSRLLGSLRHRGKRLSSIGSTTSVSFKTYLRIRGNGTGYLTLPWATPPFLGTRQKGATPTFANPCKHRTWLSSSITSTWETHPRLNWRLESGITCAHERWARSSGWFSTEASRSGPGYKRWVFLRSARCATTTRRDFLSTVSWSAPWRNAPGKPTNVSGRNGNLLTIWKSHGLSRSWGKRWSNKKMTPLGSSLTTPAASPILDNL
jgi:hypothetical protein